MPGLRDTQVYRAARARGDAIRSGAPCEITAEQKRGLYVDCTGLVGGHSRRAVHIRQPHQGPVDKSGINGDPVHGRRDPNRRPPLLGA